MGIFRREPRRKSRQTRTFDSSIRVRTPQELDRRLQKPARKSRKGKTRKTTSRFDAAMPMPLSAPRVRQRNERRTIEFDPAIFALGWRYLSLAIFVVALGGLVWLHTDDQFYVYSAEIEGLKYANPDDVFLRSKLYGMNAFWVNETQAEERIMAANLGIADVDVDIVWPGKLFITLTEAVPVMVWQSGDRVVWVDEVGTVVSEANGNMDLLPIVVDDGSLSLEIDSKVPLVAMNTAHELKRLRGNIEMLHYDAANGISYQDGRGWRVYFGIENDVTLKLVRYESFVAEQVEPSGSVPSGIKVLDPDAISIVP